MAGPILQLIKPLVAGNPNPAWFVHHASGAIMWAQNPTVALCTRLGIAAEEVTMGADQYNRYLSMATAGWNPALGAIPGVPPSKAATAALASEMHGPDPAVAAEAFPESS